MRVVDLIVQITLSAVDGSGVCPAPIHGRSAPPILALTPTVGVQDTSREVRGTA